MTELKQQGIIQLFDYLKIISIGIINDKIYQMCFENG